MRNLDTALCLAVLCHAVACGGGDTSHRASADAKADLGKDTCIDDLKRHAWDDAFTACDAAYSRTREPRLAASAAQAAYYAQRPWDVLLSAVVALDGPFAGEAYYYAGAALRELGQPGAEGYLAAGAARLAAANKPAFAARAYQQLAGAAFAAGRYRDAATALEACSAAAQHSRDDRMAVSADVARADVLRTIGDLRGAELAIEHAVGAAQHAEDRVVVQLKRAILHLDQQHHELARAPLGDALALERSMASRAPILESLHLNLALVERKAGNLAGALAHLEEALRAGGDSITYRWQRGLVRADAGELAGAREDLEAAEAAGPSGAVAAEIPEQLAVVLARLGDRGAAIAADRRAIAQVARLAANAGAFGATVIANYRAAHLHLIGLYAEQGRWRDALAIVAAMDSQALLGSRELASDHAPIAAPPLAASEAASRGGVPSGGELDRAIAAWRGRRLIVVVPGGARVWRIEVRDGDVRGADAGDAVRLGQLARVLETNPGNTEAGRALGAAMLPAAESAASELALLVVGPLARAPLAGLRLADQPAAARYQLVRVPGVLPREATAHGSAAVIAIGDPNGDLPAAQREAARLAGALGGRALLGAQATRAAFRDAAGAGTELLHIAARTAQREAGAMLELADGAITIGDIAALAQPPRMVVLASCGAAVGRDDAGNGSLTQAFLDAGAELVIATRWSVRDGEAAALIGAFYDAGGARDPVRALGEAQRASGVARDTAAAFEVWQARPLLHPAGRR